MAFIQWIEQYSINVEQIDGEHKKLVGMINHLQRSLSEGIVNKEIGVVLKELVDYTGYHFTDEEKLMQQIKYADYGRHCRLHKDLTAQVVKILNDLKDGKEITVFDLLSFLRTWLIDHIILEDKKIGEAYSVRVKSALRPV